MSSLLRGDQIPGELDPGEYLECVGCTAPFVNPLDVALDERCPSCGHVVFILRNVNRSKASNRFPPAIREFTMTPTALWDHGHLIGLSGHDKAVVTVLNRHYRQRGDRAFPSLPTLASRTGFSTRTVRRSLDGMVERGLLGRQRDRQNDGKWRRVRYDLEPLWEALAQAVESDPVASQATGCDQHEEAP